MLWSDMSLGEMGEVGEVGEGSSDGEMSDMAVPSSFLLAAASRSRRFLFFFWDARFLLSVGWCGRRGECDRCGGVLKCG